MAPDTEGFKYRANITMNTNFLNESTGRRTIKAWLSVSRSSKWSSFVTSLRVPPFPPPPFLLGKRNDGPTSLKRYRPFCSEPHGY